MSKRRKSSDGGLVPAILELCAAMGIEADRRNSGEVLVTRGKSTYVVKLCKAGTFDIQGYVRQFTGLRVVPFEIECKTTTGEARKAQVARAKLLTRLGVPWVFARSIGQAKAFLEGLRDS